MCSAPVVSAGKNQATFKASNSKLVSLWDLPRFMRDSALKSGTRDEESPTQEHFCTSSALLRNHVNPACFNLRRVPLGFACVGEGSGRAETSRTKTAANGSGRRYRDGSKRA